MDGLQLLLAIFSGLLPFVLLELLHRLSARVEAKRHVLPSSPSPPLPLGSSGRSSRAKEARQRSHQGFRQA